MSSVKSISSSNLVPDDLAKRIGQNGINIILATMWLSYSDLKKARIITTLTDEDSITVEWYAMIYNRWTSENRASQVKIRLVPYNQFPDPTLKQKRGKTPTIDFCFREWGTDNCYFGAECKRLRSDQPPLAREYVENGVKRFVIGKYGSKSTISAMVGYIQEGKVSDIIELIKLNMTSTSLQQNLVREILEPNPQYKSVHIRDLDLLSITLHHLFFDFVA